ncbi:MAG: hypothetical protein E3J66_07690 [Dehalococcoidia bacterium]|nr:MAG: hypothetical protein E3J66_07690 [Dehalococcoidia bacterium]
MPGLLRMTTKEANDLAALIEENGGNADSLRTAVNDVNNPGNGNTSVPVGRLSDEEYLMEKRSQTEIEHDTDLECLICHDKFDHLLSGTCEVCFREWMLSTKPKD